MAQPHVRVMVPYPPAGGADTTARIFYATARRDLGQQFAIENRGGAGGTIGEEVVAKADARWLHASCTTPPRSRSTARSMPICHSTIARISNRSFSPRWCRTFGGHAVVAGEDRCRRDRARQGHARRHRYGVIGQRHTAASLSRNVPLRDRHHDQSHALSRRRAGADRRHGRAGEVLLRQRLVGRSA